MTDPYAAALQDPEFLALLAQLQASLDNQNAEFAAQETNTRARYGRQLREAGERLPGELQRSTENAAGRGMLYAGGLLEEQGDINDRFAAFNAAIGEDETTELNGIGRGRLAAQQQFGAEKERGLQGAIARALARSANQPIATPNPTPAPGTAITPAPGTAPGTGAPVAQPAPAPVGTPTPGGQAPYVPKPEDRNTVPQLPDTFKRPGVGRNDNYQPPTPAYTPTPPPATRPNPVVGNVGPGTAAQGGPGRNIRPATPVAEGHLKVQTSEGRTMTIRDTPQNRLLAARRSWTIF